MPRRNGTGPQGRGPLTGRSLGLCGNENGRIPVRGQTQSLRKRIRNRFGNMFGWKRGRSQGFQEKGQGRRAGRGRFKIG